MASQLVGAKVDLATERPSDDPLSDLANVREEIDGPELTWIGLRNRVDDGFLPCQGDAA